MGCKLLCGKCGRSSMTWLDPDREDLLENGIMECNDSECKEQFVGIAGWQKAWEEKRGRSK